MSNFFQRLIELGEEEGSTGGQREGQGFTIPFGLTIPSTFANGDGNNVEGSNGRGNASNGFEVPLTEMSREELVDHAKRLTSQLRDWKQRYEQLQSESQTLQSEYDSYRKKVDAMQREQLEQRAQDKSLIEQLRRAGTSGNVGEAFVKQTEEQVRELKLRLRESVEEMQKAFKRQRAAEDARATAEQSKKKELEDLWEKFDAFKSRTLRQQEAYEKKLEEVRHTSEHTAHAETHEAGNASDDAPATTAAGSSHPHGPSETATASIGAHDIATQPVQVKQAEETVGSPSDAATAAQLHTLQIQLSTALQRAKEKEAALQKCEERIVRLQEDAKWDDMETEKRSAELRTQIEEAKTKISQLESKLEARDEEAVQKEKDFRRQVRELEEAIVREKENTIVAQNEADRLKAEFEKTLEEEREKLAQHTALVGEAESESRNASETSRLQKNHYESQLRSKESALQVALGNQRSLELALNDARGDVHHHIETCEDLRRELDRMSERVNDLENQLANSQRLISLREEEVLTREQERQKHRAMLRNEEDTNLRLQKTNSELEGRLVDLEMEVHRKTSQLAEMEREEPRRERELQAARAKLSDVEQRLNTKEMHLNEAIQQLEDKESLTSKYDRLREDSDVQVRQYVTKIKELEAERTNLIARRLTGGGMMTEDGDAGFSEGPLPSPSSNLLSAMQNRITVSDPYPSSSPSGGAGMPKQSLVQEAVANARRLRQSVFLRNKMYIIVAAGVLVFFVLFSSIIATGGSSNYGKELECLIQLSQCRHQLDARRST